MISGNKMKDYTLGIIKHRCSTAMKKGKYVQIYENTYKKRCPNCRKLLKVKRV